MYVGLKRDSVCILRDEKLISPLRFTSVCVKRHAVNTIHSNIETGKMHDFTVIRRSLMNNGIVEMRPTNCDFLIDPKIKIGFIDEFLSYRQFCIFPMQFNDQIWALKWLDCLFSVMSWD